MIEYVYEAVNDQQAVIRGQLTAKSVSEAVDQLESQGLNVTSIQNLSAVYEKGHDDKRHAPSDLGVTKKEDPGSEHRVLCQRIEHLLEKRDLITNGLAAFSHELPPGKTRKELSELINQLQSGATAEQLYGCGNRTISWLLLLGRETGSPQLLSDLFHEATRENESQRQWNRVFLYPAYVFFASLGIFVFLSIAILPSFKNIFDDFDLELPAITSWTLNISTILTGNPIGSVLGLLGIVLGFYVIFLLLRTWSLPGRVGNLLAAGNSWQVSAMARFARSLSEAFEAGLNLPEALRVAGNANGRGALRRLALQLASEAEHSDFSLSQSPKAFRLPATIVHALQAGHENQPSVPLLHQLAELYTARIHDRHNLLTGFIAQFAMVCIGLIVGFVILALFLPLVELLNGLTG